MTLAYPSPDPNPDSVYEEPLVECAGCLREIGEDDQLDLEGDVMCPGCALDKLAEDASAVLNPYYSPSPALLDRLDAGMVTFKALIREVERRVNAAKARR